MSGSFRTPALREKEDSGLLEGPPLAEGEWIRYWAVMPHGLTARVTSEATVADVSRAGRVSASFDPGRAAMARYVFGIIDWWMLDETGAEVPWSRDDGARLLEGLSPEVFAALGRLIDGQRPAPPLGSLSVPGDERSETVGEAFGGRFTRSSPAARRPPRNSRRSASRTG